MSRQRNSTAHEPSTSFAPLHGTCSIGQRLTCTAVTLHVKAISTVPNATKARTLPKHAATPFRAAHVSLPANAVSPPNSHPPSFSSPSAIYTTLHLYDRAAHKKGRDPFAAHPSHLYTSRTPPLPSFFVPQVPPCRIRDNGLHNSAPDRLCHDRQFRCSGSKRPPCTPAVAGVQASRAAS